MLEARYLWCCMVGAWVVGLVGGQETLVTVMVGGEARFDLSPWGIDEVRCIRGNHVIEAGERYAYEDVGVGILKVRQVVMEDYGQYKCQKSPAHIEEKVFNLLVVDGITMTVTPSQVSNPGEVIAVMCRTEVNVDLNLRLTEEQQLHFHLDVEEEEKMMVDSTIEVIGEERRELEVVFNVTVENSMDMKNLSCRLSSTLPPFLLTKSHWIQLAFGPTEIIFPNTRKFKVGELLNCTSHAHPEPMVTWQPVNVPSNCDGNQHDILSTLTFASLTLKCHGYQSWYCVVTYHPDGLDPTDPNSNILKHNNDMDPNGNHSSLAKPTQLLELFNFTVEGGPEGEGLEGDGLSNEQKTILGIVLGLGIPLLLILLLLITCCLCRKKGSKKGRKTTLSKVIDPTKKQPPPTSLKAAPRPLVNAAPNPQASQIPANVVRGSPGIPDIGARHLGGSGSIPQLNESVEGGRQYSNYSEMAGPVNFGKADLGGRKAFTDI